MPTFTLGEDTKLLVSPTEAARLLDVSRQYIYALMARGQLDSITIGRSRKIPLEAVRRIATEGTPAA